MAVERWLITALNTIVAKNEIASEENKAEAKRVKTYIYYLYTCYLNWDRYYERYQALCANQSKYRSCFFTQFHRDCFNIGHILYHHQHDKFFALTTACNLLREFIEQEYMIEHPQGNQPFYTIHPHQLDIGDDGYQGDDDSSSESASSFPIYLDASRGPTPQDKKSSSPQPQPKSFTYSIWNSLHSCKSNMPDCALSSLCHDCIDYISKLSVHRTFDLPPYIHHCTKIPNCTLQHLSCEFCRNTVYEIMTSS